MANYRITETTYSGPGDCDRPWPLDDNGKPIIPIVDCNLIRVGQMSGEIVDGFFECDIAFYCSAGNVVQWLTRSLAMQITDDMRPIVDRWKAGTSSDADESALINALLTCPECFALAV